MISNQKQDSLYNMASSDRDFHMHIMNGAIILQKHRNICYEHRSILTNRV